MPRSNAMFSTINTSALTDAGTLYSNAVPLSLQCSQNREFIEAMVNPTGSSHRQAFLTIQDSVGETRSIPVTLSITEDFGVSTTPEPSVNGLGAAVVSGTCTVISTAYRQGGKNPL